MAPFALGDGPVLHQNTPMTHFHHTSSGKSNCDICEAGSGNIPTNGYFPIPSSHPIIRWLGSVVHVVLRPLHLQKVEENIRAKD